jgi:hypothetical protein
MDHADKQSRRTLLPGSGPQLRVDEKHLCQES